MLFESCAQAQEKLNDIVFVLGLDHTPLPRGITFSPFHLYGGALGYVSVDKKSKGVFSKLIKQTDKRWE